MQNPKVISETRIFEAQLRRYAILYFMLGLIEKKLRTRVMITLSSFAGEKGYTEWFLVLPQTVEHKRSIHHALRKNRNQTDGIEEYLSFSFWRRLFVGSNYISLWIPALHLVFPSLKDPLEKKSFDRVGNYLYLASQIRNRVAHYDIHGAADFEREKSVLMWLIKAMSGPSQ